ncbi:MAG: DUF1460 domain-containing protein [Odoribacteraceae bacterium]|jgi:hypothetical protein|nr:DUF1460 domain-containing protein [Odoribacteraceae bacterium]
MLIKTALPLLFLLLSARCSGGDTATIPVRDRVVLERYLEHARQHRLTSLPLHERVVAIGRFFLRVPYLSGTLDDGGPERLIVNLNEMDCVTFVDNVLALALLDAHDDESATRFLHNLRRLRYRDGKIDGYSSRLHYSTDWLFEMQRQGILRVVEWEGAALLPVNEVHYLSRHLREDTALIAGMAAVERAINARETRYLPKGEVKTRTGQLRAGDIVLIATTRDSLDTSHLGIAVEVDGNIHLLHASSDAREVVISPVPLRNYLQPVRRHAGIIVARPTGDATTKNL